MSLAVILDSEAAQAEVHFQPELRAHWQLGVVASNLEPGGGLPSPRESESSLWGTSRSQCHTTRRAATATQAGSGARCARPRPAQTGLQVQVGSLRADTHWQARADRDPARKSPIPDEFPVPPIPDSDLAGKRGGNSRFPIGRESGIGKRAVSSDSAGKREDNFGVPIRRKSGNRGSIHTLRCEYSCSGLDVALKLLQMQILAFPHLPSSTAKDRPMEDGDSDSDAEIMAARDYGTDSSDDICRPKLCPSLLQLMLGRHSGIGNPSRIPRFPGFWGDFPIPDSRSAGNRELESGIGPLPDRPGTGNRGPDSASRGFEKVPGLGPGPAGSPIRAEIMMFKLMTRRSGATPSQT